MSISIGTSSATGAELIGQLMIKEGVLSIQKGDNPRIIEEKLLAFLGGDKARLVAEYRKNKAENAERSRRLAEDFINSIKDRQNHPLVDKTLIDYLMRPDIMRIIRDFSPCLLVNFLRCLGGELLRYILGNMSGAMRGDVIEKLAKFDDCPPFTDEFVKRTQDEVKQCIKKLSDRGEVFISREVYVELFGETI